MDRNEKLRTGIRKLENLSLTAGLGTYQWVFRIITRLRDKHHDLVLRFCGLNTIQVYMFGHFDE